MLTKSTMTARRAKAPIMAPTMTAMGCVFRLPFLKFAREKSLEYDIVSVVDVAVIVYNLLI